MNREAKIYVAGHRGMVGSAICAALQQQGFSNLVTRTSQELDLRQQEAVRQFFSQERPEYVFLAAAKVGGILANNQYRAEFIYDNLMMQTNVIDAAYRHQVKKLLFLGSSCIYPKLAPQPLQESALLTGLLEPTNEPYAIAKIAGIKMCEAYRAQYGCNFISVMPTNLYGPKDNYDLLTSHVLPALIRKIHEAKVSGASSVTVWGSGQVRREFLHTTDLAEACLFLMQQYNEPGIINVGCGQDLTIRELAQMLSRIIGFTGELVYDSSRPDGTPRKLMDVSKIHQLGWKARIDLESGLRSVYAQYQSAPWETISMSS